MEISTTQRRTLAAGLVGGALCFTLADLVRRVVEPAAPSPSALTRAVADHPSLWLLAGLLSAATAFLLPPAMVVVPAIVRGRGHRLATTGALLTGIGAVAAAVHAAGYFGSYGIYASSGADRSAVRAMESGSEGYPFFTVFIVLFMAGMLLGPLLLGIGLRRARLVPVWVPVAALVFAAAGGTSGAWPGVIGVLAAVATFVPVAMALVGRPVRQPGSARSQSRTSRAWVFGGKTG
jgi:MFS family permease